jgi:chemotaxis protein CheZ
MNSDLDQPANPANSTGELLGRIGQLTRQLRDGLRELGLDKQVAMAAQAIPDARDRLSYVAAMTERAADRALNAIDVAQPMQEALASAAKGLDQRWAQWAAGAGELDPAHQLVVDTRAYLGQVPATANAINAQLMEIMMAQDFQDLTGQVIKKMMDVINQVEMDLLQVLIDNSPPDKRDVLAVSLQNGPQLKPGNPSAVAGQAQVDDLLESLGF